VWAEEVASGRYQLAASVRADGIWSAPARFYLGQQPDLAAASDGRVHLVYANEAFGNREIYYTYWTGSGWQPSRNISNSSGSSSQPAIVVTTEGHLVVVWTEELDGSDCVEYAWQTAGVWNTFRVPTSTGGSYPDIALGAQGRIWVTWQVPEDGTNRAIYGLSGAYDDGITWSQFALNISDCASSDATLARLTGSAHTGAFVAWQQHSATGDDAIYYADTLQYGEYWSKPVGLSAGGVQARLPAIAAGAAGAVHVGWQQENTAAHAWRFPGTDWSAPEVMSGDATEVAELSLSVGPDLGLEALWSQSAVVGNRELYGRQGALAWPVHVELPLLRR
jgi:hypothetical protein